MTWSTASALTIVGPEVETDNGYYITWPVDRRTAEADALIDWLRAEAVR